MVSTTKHYGIIVGIDGSPESDAAVNWAAHDAAIRKYLQDRKPGEGRQPRE